MIAVCARRPRDLFSAVAPEVLRSGVYTFRRGTDAIRVVVAVELPREEHNALLHLFSAAPDQVQYGAEHYRTQSADTSTVVNQLFAEYRVEGLPMPYTMTDFKRDLTRQTLQNMTAEERLAFLEKLSPEERLAGLSAEQIEAYLKKRTATPKKKRKR
jgi:hypothetical protein